MSGFVLERIEIEDVCDEVLLMSWMKMVFR
jgi:hypothetical protein